MNGAYWSTIKILTSSWSKFPFKMPYYDESYSAGKRIRLSLTIVLGLNSIGEDFPALIVLHHF